MSDIAVRQSGTGAGPAARPIGRILAFDGLRGVAAAVVMVFHFLCLLHPELAPSMHTAPHGLVDSPLALLWNGPFAVVIFFVLSGFVMAAAAERRHGALATNLVTRYLRLALPMLASVLLAWALLSAFPTAARQLGEAAEDPSRWLRFTYQGDIPPFTAAVRDALVDAFATGGSSFNNVLWTMRIELIGSFGIFGIYWLSAGRARLVLLGLAGAAIVAFVRDDYLAFVLGALIYEAHVRGAFDRPQAALGAVALAAGLLLGAPGHGTAERWGLPAMPDTLTIGNPVSVIAVLAAGLILVGVLLLPAAARALRGALAQWLGRVSFSLYLVHVPLLYTVIATLAVAGWPPLALAGVYVLLTFGMAQAFTLAVDEPSLRAIGQVRRQMRPLERFSAIPRLG